MAPKTSTQRCAGCASVLAPGAAWCGLCLKPTHTDTPAVSPAGPFAPASGPADLGAGQFRGTAPANKADLFSESRWRSSSVTFGPVGRVVMTFLLFLPYGLFVMNLPFGLVGIVVWTGLLVRGLRDIWRPARQHHLPPENP